MNKSEFLKMCCVDDSNVQQVLTCHPKQIISDVLRIPVWAVRHKYLTQRNNEKESTKYILNYTESEWDGVENEFNNYIAGFNSKNPNRQLSNVEILDITYLGNLIIDID